MKLVIEDAAGTRSVVPFSGGELTVGRAAEGNAFRLPDRNVSRHHARFQLVNGAASVEDLGSLGGTRVNGERISGRRRLREGDLVEIGDYDLAVVADEGLAEVAGPGAPPPLPGPPAAPPPAAAAPPRAAPHHPASAPALARPPPQRPPVSQAAPAPPRPDAHVPARPMLLVAACLAALAIGAVLGLVVGGVTAPRTPAARSP